MANKLDDFQVKIRITPELDAEQLAMHELLYDFNHARPSERDKKRGLLKQILGSHNGANIMPPFYCDFGKNIHFKEGGFINYGVTILDIAPVNFGRYVQVGPNTVISTTGHPLDLAERVQPYAIGNEINIEDNVWIGAGVMILEGVTIGARSVIGAGSVVNRDIPPDSVAVGSPAKVIKTITHGEMPTEEELMEMWAPMLDLDIGGEK